MRAVSAMKQWNIRAVFFPRSKATGNVGYVSSMYSRPETVDSLKGKLNLRDIERGKRRLLRRETSAPSLERNT